MQREGQSKGRKVEILFYRQSLKIKAKEVANDAQLVSSEAAGVDWDSMSSTSTTVSAFTSAFTADSKSVSSSTPTTSRRCANQKDRLAEVDPMNRRKLAKCGILKMHGRFSTAFGP
ncbi:hypothetical protein EGR_10994 [Echinococcus granulosus]|uniref:Uncharacterized protein n=1 Tax=Echinococcus granulosus TaxID=6210 RepID=W6UKX6_ECHGR|nr:hypothetical protein EGR_10994 [Echinococcus granulosus]EUB54149.1 hypothetical protein EGR_10994 [Echinococcus granulosus]